MPILTVLFSLGGAVFGMGEEAIPFVMILVPMFIAMGYDAVVGIMCSYVATQIGFGTSWQNPFGLAVAQGIAGIPVMSGAWFRIPLWIIFTALTCVFTMRYAAKVKKIRSSPLHMSLIRNTERTLRRTARQIFRLHLDISWCC